MKAIATALPARRTEVYDTRVNALGRRFRLGCAPFSVAFCLFCALMIGGSQRAIPTVTLLNCQLSDISLS